MEEGGLGRDRIGASSCRFSRPASIFPVPGVSNRRPQGCGDATSVYNLDMAFDAHFLSKKPKEQSAATLVLGALSLYGRAFLAPMAGVTDYGMRRLAQRFGATLTVSEM